MLFKALVTASMSIIAAFGLAGTSYAGTPPDCRQASADCVVVGEWQVSVGLGAGIRTNPVIDSDNIPLVLLPEISYYGERFFLENLDFGYTLHQSDTQMFNMLLTPGYDQLFFNRWDPQNFFVDSTLSTATLSSDRDSFAPEQTVGEKWIADDTVDLDKLHKRRMAAMAGFDYSAHFGQMEWYAQALQDVADVHNGHELRIGVGKVWRHGDNDFALAGGAIWQSADLLHYYYGVGADEVTRPSAAYQAPSGTSGFIRFDWSRPINERWSWRGTVQYKKLSSSIAESPLVDRNNVITAFIGGVYHF